jgi:hypothetical protein
LFTNYLVRGRAETFRLAILPLARPFSLLIGHNYDSLTYGELNNHLAVNFAYDIFYLAGEIRELDDQLREKVLCLRKIVLDHGYSAYEFLDSLPKMQELWVLFKHQAQLNLLSGEEYQTAWSAHHCYEFPDDFYPYDLYDGFQFDREGRAHAQFAIGVANFTNHMKAYYHHHVIMNLHLHIRLRYKRFFQLTR